MDFNSFQDKASLLTLPIETRFMIYDLLIDCTGSLVVFAQYETTRDADEPTMRLLHVNRLIRSEVLDYFYKNQNFHFRSIPAMEKFLHTIGTYHASIIKDVVIGSWLAQRAAFVERVAPLLKMLTGIERLTITAPAHGFVTEWSHEAGLGDKSIAVLEASERLVAGKLYLSWAQYGGVGEMQFVAPGSPHRPGKYFRIHDAYRTPNTFYWPSSTFVVELDLSDLSSQHFESQKSEIVGDIAKDEPPEPIGQTIICKRR